MLLAVALMSLASCTVRKAQWNALLDVESYIEEHPDSALSILEAMSAEKIHGRKAEAKFSLLYSMALDKNYIDTADLSIIAPAVQYYRHHGSATDKMLANYYRGIISFNAEDYEEAMQYFVAAENHVNKSVNKLAAGRLFTAITKVYQYSYDTEGSIRSSKRAASFYFDSGNTTWYINSTFDIIHGCINQKDTLNASLLLKQVRDNWDKLSMSQKSRYYAFKFNLNEITGAVPYETLITEYLDEIDDPEAIHWTAVADAFYQTGDYDKAMEALHNDDLYNEDHDAAYYIVSAQIYDALNKDREAKDAYRNYIEATDSKFGYLVEADIRFLKERHDAELARTRKNLMLIIVFLGALILLMLSVFAYKRIRLIQKEKRVVEEQKQKYQRMYNSAVEEVRQLNETLENTINSDIRERIIERIDLLNSFISDNIKNYTEEESSRLEEMLRDKAYFIESIRGSFVIAHPEFVTELKNRGLDDEEIGYCCLYAIGLKGKDITTILGNRHYKFSSNIRKKFGLTEHDTNMDIFIREIFKKVEE